MFTLQNVTLKKRSAGKDISILTAINLDIASGRTTVLIGPSGAGKSSLLRLLNRLDDPTGGLVLLEGKPLHSYPVLALRRRVGMFFQIPVMFPGTVAQNIHYAFQNFTDSPPRKEEAPKGVKPVSELLQMVGLSPEIAAHNADQLSVGQQQRVALARTLANNPEVLLLDEPTASLDAVSAIEILELTRRLQSELGLTVIMVTHILGQARQFSDAAIFIQAGRVLESGSTDEVFGNPQTEAARQFILGQGDAG